MKHGLTLENCLRCLHRPRPQHGLSTLVLMLVLGLAGNGQCLPRPKVSSVFPPSGSSGG